MEASRSIPEPAAAPFSTGATEVIQPRTRPAASSRRLTQIAPAAVVRTGEGPRSVQRGRATPGTALPVIRQGLVVHRPNSVRAQRSYKAQASVDPLWPLRTRCRALPTSPTADKVKPYVASPK